MVGEVGGRLCDVALRDKFTGEQPGAARSLHVQHVLTTRVHGFHANSRRFILKSLSRDRGSGRHGNGRLELKCTLTLHLRE